MSFATLKADIDLFREVDELEFGTAVIPVDADVLAIKYDLAKQIFESDCKTIFKLWNVTSISTKLDSLVSEFTSNFQTALMYLQIHLFYQSKAGSQGEATNERASYYFKQYQNETNKFYNFDSVDVLQPTPIKTFKL